MFSLTERSEIGHIALAEYPDLIVIAPATANIIGKVASRLADDLLSTTIMATRAPVLFCPAMNTNMYMNGIVEENISKLMKCGYFFLSPDRDNSPAGRRGPGRLPDPGSDVVRGESSRPSDSPGKVLPEGERMVEFSARPTRRCG